MTDRSSVVFDFGKTRLKASLVDPRGTIDDQIACETTVVSGPPYPHLDVDRAWRWMLQSLLKFSAAGANIGVIVPVTHGATAAVIRDDGLALPVMDYEWDGLRLTSLSSEYLMHDFANTLSPELPAGLNLGRQLLWMAEEHSDAFRLGTAILTYPQYWAWRLSGVAATEITSLGCHTGLWNVKEGRLSRLGELIDSIVPFAPLRAAGSDIGSIIPAVASAAQIGYDCRVINGLHDSNASYFRHLDAAYTQASAVVSTGTWVIVFASGENISILDESRDMLANVDAFGRPVACARFMGGREYEEIALGKSGAANLSEVQSIVDSGIMALPCFAPLGGPYRHAGRIIPEVRDEDRIALASLYLALMTHDTLQRLGIATDVIVEGAFVSNAAFIGLLAALIEPRRLFMSNDTNGTTEGAWLLAHPNKKAMLAKPQQASPWKINGLPAYAARWRARVQECDRQ